MSRVSLEQAREFQRTCPVVDAHCDTLVRLGEGQRLTDRLEDTHVDLDRLEKGQVAAQFFACWIAPSHNPHRSLERALELVERFYAEVEGSGGRLTAVTGPSGVRECFAEGRVAGILSLEGAEPLGTNLALIGSLHRLGVRSITLTWNNRNAIADGVGDARTRGGLSEFGVAAVREMQRLGMLVDVSHISEAGFRQVLEVASKPVIASHSNARALCDHPRNLTDDQIKALAAAGGVMGLNLCPSFVTRDPEEADLERALDHVDHVVGLVGDRHVGLGMDLDGIRATPKGFADVADLPHLTRGLLERGHGEEAVRRILGGNFLRVMAEVGMA